MARQLFAPVIPATSDSHGKITFQIPQAAGANLTASLIVAIVDAGHAGFWTALSSSQVTFGPWSGAQPFGPIVITANETVTITGQGLLPSATYHLQVSGVVDYLDNFPAALLLTVPTGSTALFGADSMVNVPDDGTHIVKLAASFPAPGAQIQYGFFPTQNFAGMRLSVQVQSGGPLDVNCSWYDETGTGFIASRDFIVGPLNGPGDILEITMPHLGDLLQITVTNNPATTASFNITAVHTTASYAAYGGADVFTYNAATADGAVILAPGPLYGGPAHLECYPEATTWGLTAQVMDEGGTWRDLWVRNTTAGIGGTLPVNFLMPARPFQLVAGNTDGSPKTFIASLAYDLSRVG